MVASPPNRGLSRTALTQYASLQLACIENAPFRSGYCTPGMIPSAKSLLDENADVNVEKIKDHRQGNISRCTGYKTIKEAIVAVAGRMAEDSYNLKFPATIPAWYDLVKIMRANSS